MKKLVTLLLFILTGLGLGLCPAEVWSEDTQVHGFGGWAYGITDGNKYLIADEDGAYTNSYFALNLSASPYEKLSANVQTFWKTSDEGLDMDLDYAFAEWTFIEWLKLRIGKVKCPFGIYTETWDVGTLRPFYTLPAGIYGTPGMMATKAYYGLGLTGARDLGSSWGLQYDLYGGKMVFPEMVGPGMDNPLVPVKLAPTMKNSGGARISVQTPLEGLSVGLSVTAGDVEFWSGGKQIPYYIGDWHFFLGGHAEYLNDPVSLRVEYGYAQSPKKDDVVINSYYAEGAYKFLEHFQVAVRYDVKLFDVRFQLPIENTPDDNKDLGFGLNYWFNPNLVIKASYHYVQGNLMAMPEDMTEYLAELLKGTLEETTHLFIFGPQFSF